MRVFVLILLRSILAILVKLEGGFGLKTNFIQRLSLLYSTLLSKAMCSLLLISRLPLIPLDYSK